MRRLVVLLTLLALAIPLAASAAVRTAGDGTLSVRDLDGFVRIRATGGVIGRCDQCSLFLNEQVRADEIIPIVSGGKGIENIDDDIAKERYVGKDVRWKVIGGSFNMVVRNSTDVDLSVVGKGRVWIYGSKGSYVLNGGQSTYVLPGPPAEQFPLNAAAPQ